MVTVSAARASGARSLSVPEMMLFSFVVQETNQYCFFSPLMTVLYCTHGWIIINQHLLFPVLIHE